MTLNDICNKIYKEAPFTELSVMYRTNLPDMANEYEDDTLFGYCTVTKKMSGFAVNSDDGDDYYMSDVIEKYEYKPDYFDGLVVWFRSEWSN